MSHLKKQIAEARARGDLKAVAAMERIERKERLKKLLARRNKG